MEECVAATVGFEAPAQVVPPLDLMYRLVLNQALEDDRRCLPVDSLQRQEAAVEPGAKQVCEVVVYRRAIGMIRERLQKAPAQVDESDRPARCHVPSAEKLLPRPE